MPTEKKIGRRPSYAPDLIAAAEARSGIAKREDVKAILFEKHGVKITVRPEPLDAAAEAHLAEHQRQRDDAAIAQLPEAVRSEFDTAAAAVARLLAVTYGRQADKSHATLALRLEEESRQHLELVRSLTEAEAALASALATAQASERAAEARQAVIEVRDRQIIKLEKSLARLEGIIEGRRSMAPKSRESTDGWEETAA